ncbi:MAG: hypothetical protein ACLRNC_11980 [Gemmiger formicilis]|uniref:hypothetical protein n=1 Tax=Gemmiger formicilis TaxID=745368 RepID=UPI003A18DF85
MALLTPAKQTEKGLKADGTISSERRRLSEAQASAIASAPTSEERLYSEYYGEYGDYARAA